MPRQVMSFLGPYDHRGCGIHRRIRYYQPTPNVEIKVPLSGCGYNIHTSHTRNLPIHVAMQTMRQRLRWSTFARSARNHKNSGLAQNGSPCLRDGPAERLLLDAYSQL